MIVSYFPTDFVIDGALTIFLGFILGWVFSVVSSVFLEGGD